MPRLFQRQRRYRRLFHVALVVAATFLILLLIQRHQLSLLQSTLSQTQTFLAEARRTANLGNRAREQAEDLTSFILDDLRFELIALGRTDILGESARRSLDYFENLPPELKGLTTTDALATIHNTLANVHYAEGSFDESVAAWQASLRNLEHLHRAEPDNDSHLYHLIETHNELAIILREAGRVEEAMVASQQALKRLDSLAPDSDNNQYRINRAASLFSLAENQRFLENYEQAIPFYQEAQKAFAEDIPKEVIALQIHMTSFNNEGYCHLCLGDIDAALKAYLAALIPNRDLIQLEPGNRHWQKEIATVLNNIGTIHDENEDADLAFRYLDESLALRESLVLWDPVNTRWQLDYATSLHNHASLHLDLNAVEKALPYIRKTFDVYQLLISREPEQENWLRRLQDTLRHFNDRLVHDVGRPDLAKKLSTEVTDALAELPRDAVTSPAWNLFLSSLYGELGNATIASTEEAIESRLKATSLRARNLQLEPENPERAYELATAYLDLGEDYLAASEPHSARVCIQLCHYLLARHTPPLLFRREPLIDICHRHQQSLSPDATMTLVPSDAIWNYEDRRYPPAEDWNTLSFDDSAWKSGPAKLGYGDSDEATLINFGGDPDRKNLTAWFRHRFEVDTLSGLTPLRLSLLCDDGAVVYLNGEEIIRHGLPPGPITATTTSSIMKSGFEEDVFRIFMFSAEELPLIMGENVLAVEVHQNEPQSSDLALALEVLGGAPLRDPLDSFDQELAEQVLGEALPPILRTWLSAPEHTLD
ncbi:MAG: tetratricopeptide repeat protein [Verrucomicrobiota bacterium JB023]|nr:tetratricopeptide repeat protein [Verrucomicrobiota bacterium JB023]